MKLRTLSPKKNLKGVPVLVRVDWNIPLSGVIADEHHLKIQRSKPLLKELQQRGAIVVLLTHLGRPAKKETRYSTKHLVSILKKQQISVTYLTGSVSNQRDRKTLLATLQKAAAGSLFLLENVRFEKGEEKNDKQLAKAYAELAQVYMNDAFASSHRKHASVAAIASYTDAYAGPALVQEVLSLESILKKPAKPFNVIMGGKKLSTKIGVIKTLKKQTDGIYVGSAMAIPFWVNRGWNVGKSTVEKEALSQAKALAASTDIRLPIDVTVTQRLQTHPKIQYKAVEDIQPQDIIVDIGPRTLKLWHEQLAKAKTILWNGPVGITEIQETGFGTRGLAKSIAKHHKHARTMVGGGDTVPLVIQLGLSKSYDVISTGGGAMLEFLEKEGKLPGLLVLR